MQLTSIEHRAFSSTGSPRRLSGDLETSSLLETGAGHEFGLTKYFHGVSISSQVKCSIILSTYWGREMKI
jgi:hypothetical protein